MKKDNIKKYLIKSDLVDDVDLLHVVPFFLSVAVLIIIEGHLFHGVYSIEYTGVHARAIGCSALIVPTLIEYQVLYKVPCKVGGKKLRVQFLRNYYISKSTAFNIILSTVPAVLKSGNPPYWGIVYIVLLVIACVLQHLTIVKLKKILK